MPQLQLKTREFYKGMVFRQLQLSLKMHDALDHVRKSFLKGFFKKRLSGGDGIKSRRGGLKTRFKSYVKVNKKTMETAVLTRSKAAESHEKGGTISSGGKMMALPLPSVKTASGKVRKKYRPSKNRTLKDVPGLFPIKVGANILLARIKGRGTKKQLEPLFILKRRIIIKPRLKFYDTWEKQKPRSIEIVNRALEKTMQGTR